jgi:hypothetical protein
LAAGLRGARVEVALTAGAKAADLRAGEVTAKAVAFLVAAVGAAVGRFW